MEMLENWWLRKIRIGMEPIREDMLLEDLTFLVSATVLLVLEMGLAIIQGLIQEVEQHVLPYQKEIILDLLVAVSAMSLVTG